jgi:hypothetical protein
VLKGAVVIVVKRRKEGNGIYKDMAEMHEEELGYRLHVAV